MPTSPGLRLALVSTPRSGNNWVRHLLANLYGLPVCGVHSPDDLDWANLPNDLAFGIHWRRRPDFERRLREHGFRVLVLCRHPLDVLISILQFCWRSPTADWLKGEGGDERPLYGAMPRSAAFADYATGPRAAALLAVTREWWGAPGCITLRYEQLVQSPEATLGQLVEVLGAPPRRGVGDALRDASLPKLRERTQCAHHFWQGKPGLWKRLLTAAEAGPIAALHAPLFAAMGYGCDPDPELTPSRADADWLELVGDALAADLRALQPTRRELADARQSLEQTCGELAGARQAVEQTRRELAGARQDLEQTRRELADARRSLEQTRRRAEEECNSLRRAYDDLRSQFAAASEYHRDLEERLAAAHQQVGEARARLEYSQQACAKVSDELGRAQGRLAPLDDLGPRCLGVARRLKRLALAYPRAARLAGRLIRVAPPPRPDGGAAEGPAPHQA